MKKVTIIALTGGPCGGKSTALKMIREYFKAEGYAVLTIEETATSMIACGVSPWTCVSPAHFQKCLFGIQLARENEFLDAASLMPAEKILIVCDRSLLDGKGYLTEEEFGNILRIYGLTEKDILSRYDAVFHMTSAAKGPGHDYTTADNPARFEDASDAAARDDRTKSFWTDHPYFRVIPHSERFEGKAEKLLEEINFFLENQNSKRK